MKYLAIVLCSAGLMSAQSNVTPVAAIYNEDYDQWQCPTESEPSTGWEMRPDYYYVPGPELPEGWEGDPPCTVGSFWMSFGPDGTWLETTTPCYPEDQAQRFAHIYPNGKVQLLSELEYYRKTCMEMSESSSTLGADGTWSEMKVVKKYPLPEWTECRESK